LKKIFGVGLVVLTINMAQAFPIKFKVNNSKSSKDYEQMSLGAQVNITEKTSLDGSYGKIKDGSYSKTTFTLGANHTYSDTYTFFGDISSSSDSSGVKGFGQSAGSDITISDYWEGELSTIATIEFGRSRYQGQETIENILYKTNYIESFWKVGLEQEIVSWMSINMARKKYTFKDSSTAILGRRSSSRHLTTLNIGPDYTNTVGVSFYKKEWPSISGNFSRTKNTDGTFDDEQNYSLLYKISNISLGGRFTHIKRSTGEVEDTWGPNIATSF
jgi:hypothetical protein